MHTKYIYVLTDDARLIEIMWQFTMYFQIMMFCVSHEGTLTFVQVYKLNVMKYDKEI